MDTIVRIIAISISQHTRASSCTTGAEEAPFPPAAFLPPFLTVSPVLSSMPNRSARSLFFSSSSALSAETVAAAAACAVLNLAARAANLFVSGAVAGVVLGCTTGFTGIPNLAALAARLASSTEVDVAAALSAALEGPTGASAFAAAVSVCTGAGTTLEVEGTIEGEAVVAGAGVGEGAASFGATGAGECGTVVEVVTSGSSALASSPKLESNPNSSSSRAA